MTPETAIPEARSLTLSILFEDLIQIISSLLSLSWIIPVCPSINVLALKKLFAIIKLYNIKILSSVPTYSNPLDTLTS